MKIFFFFEIEILIYLSIYKYEKKEFSLIEEGGETFIRFEIEVEKSLKRQSVAFFSLEEVN